MASNAEWANNLTNKELAATLEMHAKSQSANTAPTVVINEAAYRLKRTTDGPR